MWSAKRNGRAQIVLLAISFVLMVLGILTRDTPEVSVWFVWAGLGAIIAANVAAFQRWNHGRVPREKSKD